MSDEDMQREPEMDDSSRSLRENIVIRLFNP
jgi:hypothetical protein